MSRQSEADRLREHRVIFERAMRDHIGMVEARARLARERWEACERRMAARRGLCGTVAPTIGEDADEGRELAWWQR